MSISSQPSPSPSVAAAASWLFRISFQVQAMSGTVSLGPTSFRLLDEAGPNEIGGGGPHQTPSLQHFGADAVCPPASAEPLPAGGAVEATPFAAVSAGTGPLSVQLCYIVAGSPSQSLVLEYSPSMFGNADDATSLQVQ